MSYGPDPADGYRLAGVYTGRILKGEKPVRPTGHAADQVRVGHQLEDGKALDLTIPPTLLARADEVIE